MKRIFITGATGNVGSEVIKSLLLIYGTHTIIAGVKDPENDFKRLPFEKVQFQKFDFTDASTYKLAIENTDILFYYIHLKFPMLRNTSNQ